MGLRAAQQLHLVNDMEMTTEHRRKTGAYYTPQPWAELAVMYLREVLPEFDRCIFYDPAAGEGALLEALPPHVEKYATTLDPDDVDILRAKGFTAWPFDFLLGDADHLPKVLFDAAFMRRLVILTNPPFISVTNGLLREAHCTNNAAALFIYRAFEELGAQVYAGFNKVDLWTAPMLGRFRGDMAVDYCMEIPAAFVTPSFTWPGLSGRWPLLFNILTPIYSKIQGGFRSYKGESDGVHCFRSYDTPGFFIPADVYEQYLEFSTEGGIINN